MKKCYKCGMDGIGDNCRFCPNCGARLDADRICPACGSAVQASANYCPMCGTNLAGAQPAGTGSAPTPAAAPAWNVPAAAAANRGTAVTDKSGAAWIIRFLPALLLLVFSVVCFIAFMAGSGYTVSFRSSDPVSATFFGSFSDPDFFHVYFDLPEGNSLGVIGLILVLVAILSLIIGLAGFGKAARSRTGEPWTKKYRTTFVWGIIMYVLAVLASLVYIYTASGMADLLGDSGYASYIEVGLGSAPVTVIVMAAIGIVGSIVTGVLKGKAAKKYGTLDNLQTAPEKMKPAGRGVRTGYSWTVMGRSLLFFVFAVLLLVFFRMNLISDDFGRESSTSLYALVLDEHDNYGMRMAMFIIFVVAALCVLFGFIFLMTDLAKRKKIANATVPDKGTAQRSMFMIFLYCMMLLAIGYAYGKLESEGILSMDAAMAEYGYHMLGSLMSSIEALTIICLVIHIIALLAQCVLFNIFDFNAPASGPANGNPYATESR